MFAFRDPSMIRSFGFEDDGGTGSILWTDPSVFGQAGGQSGRMLDERFEAWLATKRPVEASDIAGNVYLKVTSNQRVFRVEMDASGELREADVRDPSESWTGSWRVIDGFLQSEIGPYRTRLIASVSSQMVSGPEYFEDRPQPVAFSWLSPLRDQDAVRALLSRLSAERVREVTGFVERAARSSTGGESSQRAHVSRSDPDARTRSDDELLNGMLAVLGQLRIGRLGSESWGYTNRNEVIEKLNRIAGQTSNKAAFLPALDRARATTREHIDTRWSLIRGNPDTFRSEWSKYQDVIFQGDHSVIAALKSITGAPSAYVDDNYEPERPSASSQPASRRRWWRRR